MRGQKRIVLLSEKGERQSKAFEGITQNRIFLIPAGRPTKIEGNSRKKAGFFPNWEKEFSEMGPGLA